MSEEKRRDGDPEGRIDALAEALELLGDDISSEQVSALSALLLRAHERTGLDPATTVVALVGATGSGKSSLFNALAGSDLTDVGILRPTTQEATALVPPGGGASALLDWLNIHRRVIRPAGGGIPSGVVLVDLPDIDSVSSHHRDVAARLAERVDMLIWVVDPQKYADDVIHTQWIRPLVNHADVMVTVLSQVDRLSTSDCDLIKDDLNNLLRADGLAHPVVVATSVVTGEGLGELGDYLHATSRAVAQKAARVHATLDDVTTQLGKAIGSALTLPEVDAGHLSQEFVHAASHAAGVDHMVQAVAGSYRHQAGKRTGWLPVRWVRHFRADPLASLHIRPITKRPEDSVQELNATTLTAASVTNRGSVPATSTATLNAAVRTVVARVVTGRPPLWGAAVKRVVRADVGLLPARLDLAMAQTDLSTARPSWWVTSNAAQWVGWIVAVAGIGWIAAVSAVKQWLLLAWEPPVWKGLPVPTWMVLVGVAWTLLVACASRVAALAGARRRGRVARSRLNRAIAVEVDQVLVAPLIAEHQRERRILDALSRARR